MQKLSYERHLANHSLGNHASRSSWPGRKAVELRKGRANERSLLAAKEETGESLSCGSGSPGDQGPFSRPVIAGGVRAGCRKFSGEGSTHAPSGNSTHKLRGHFIQEAS